MVARIGGCVFERPEDVDGGEAVALDFQFDAFGHIDASTVFMKKREVYMYVVAKSEGDARR